MRSSSTGVCNGAPRSFQSGSSSLRARGSSTAPESVCPPTAARREQGCRGAAPGRPGLGSNRGRARCGAFSSTVTRCSVPFFSQSCLKRMAAASPAGPPPTMSRSVSSAKRSMSTCRRARLRRRRDGGAESCGAPPPSERRARGRTFCSASSGRRASARRRRGRSAREEARLVGAFQDRVLEGQMQPPIRVALPAPDFPSCPSTRRSKEYGFSSVGFV